MVLFSLLLPLRRFGVKLQVVFWACFMAGSCLALVTGSNAGAVRTQGFGVVLFSAMLLLPVRGGNPTHGYSQRPCCDTVLLPAGGVSPTQGYSNLYVLLCCVWRRNHDCRVTSLVVGRDGRRRCGHHLLSVLVTGCGVSHRCNGRVERHGGSASRP